MNKNQSTDKKDSFSVSILDIYNIISKIMQTQNTSVLQLTLIKLVSKNLCQVDQYRITLSLNGQSQQLYLKKVPSSPTELAINQEVIFYVKNSEIKRTTYCEITVWGVKPGSNQEQFGKVHLLIMDYKNYSNKIIKLDSRFSDITLQMVTQISSKDHFQLSSSRERSYNFKKRSASDYSNESSHSSKYSKANTLVNQKSSHFLDLKNKSSDKEVCKVQPNADKKNYNFKQEDYLLYMKDKKDMQRGAMLNNNLSQLKVVYKPDMRNREYQSERKADLFDSITNNKANYQEKNHKVRNSRQFNNSIIDSQSNTQRIKSKRIIKHLKLEKCHDIKLYFEELKKPKLDIYRNIDIKINDIKGEQIHNDNHDQHHLLKKYKLTLHKQKQMRDDDSDISSQIEKNRPINTSNFNENFNQISKNQIEEEKRLQYIKLSKLRQLSKARDIAKKRATFLSVANQQLIKQLLENQAKYDKSVKYMNEKQQLFRSEFERVANSINEINHKLNQKCEESTKYQDKIRSLQQKIKEYINQIQNLKEEIKIRNTVIHQLRICCSLVQQKQGEQAQLKVKQKNSPYQKKSTKEQITSLNQITSIQNLVYKDRLNKSNTFFVQQTPTKTSIEGKKFKDNLKRYSSINLTPHKQQYQNQKSNHEKSSRMLGVFPRKSISLQVEGRSKKQQQLMLNELTQFLQGEPNKGQRVLKNL